MYINPACFQAGYESSMSRQRSYPKAPSLLNRKRMPDGTGAPGDFTDFGRSSLQVLLAEVPQVARSGEAARVGNLLEGHVRVRQQGDHVRLPLFRQPAVRSRVQLLPEPPSQRIDRHGTFPCQLLHVFHLGQSQCDLFPERAAPQVRQVLFRLLQVRLAEHRR